MTTPEGKIKAQVRKVLKKFNPRYEYWPVPAGYGASSLDCLVCIDGHLIAIETKAPGKKPTPRQEEIIRTLRAAGATVFVIGSDPKRLSEELVGLEQMLEVIGGTGGEKHTLEAA